tara:strand:+ start:180 stop:326 length:147 start_codon:yes stop_codon:yes gene_type:complete
VKHLDIGRQSTNEFSAFALLKKTRRVSKKSLKRLNPQVCDNAMAQKAR